MQKSPRGSFPRGLFVMHQARKRGRNESPRLVDIPVEAEGVVQNAHGEFEILLIDQNGCLLYHI